MQRHPQRPCHLAVLAAQQPGRQHAPGRWLHLRFQRQQSPPQGSTPGAGIHSRRCKGVFTSNLQWRAVFPPQWHRNLASPAFQTAGSPPAVCHLVAQLNRQPRSLMLRRQTSQTMQLTPPDQPTEEILNSVFRHVNVTPPPHGQCTQHRPVLTAHGIGINRRRAGKAGGRGVQSLKHIDKDDAPT